MPDDPSKSPPFDWGNALRVVAAILIIWFVVGLFPILWTYDYPTASQIGDAFGVANALFAALAFFGVLIAIHLQRQELALQREELELTRQELRGSKEAQERQAAILQETATLNALIALTTHAAKSYESAVTLGAGDDVRKVRAKEYDEYVEALKEFVEGLASKDSPGFGFMSLEEQRRAKVPVKVHVDSLAPGGSYGGQGKRRTNFRLRLIITNLTSSAINLRSVEAVLKSRTGERLQFSFRDGSHRLIRSNETATLMETTRDLDAEEGDVPLLGVVIVRTAHLKEPLRFVFDEAIAKEFQEGQSA